LEAVWTGVYNTIIAVTQDGLNSNVKSFLFNLETTSQFMLNLRISLRNLPTIPRMMDFTGEKR
jgi:hypothetical protein